LSTPTVAQYGRSWFQFTWPEVRIEVTQLREHSTDASITGRIVVTLGPPDFRKLLHSTAFKPTYQKSVDLVGQTLARKNPEKNVAEWTRMVEYVAEAVQACLAMSEPSIEISSDTPVPPMEFLVEPVLPLRDITVLFGEGGSLKSYLAMVLCMAARIGDKWIDARKLGLLPPTPENLCQTLWLDYETDQNTFTRRLAYLQRGHGLERVTLRYLRCSVSLMNDLDTVAKEVRDHNIGLIVVDSMGMAAGGDITTQAISSSFFLALRSLGKTSLVITHEAKDQMGKFFAKGKKTPYGSVYVTNAGRSVWRVEKKQDIGQSEASILVTHQKANDTAYSKPLSYRVIFDTSVNPNTNRAQQVSTKFVWIDPTKVAEFDAKTTPLRVRIVNYLGENGQVKFEDLLGLEENAKVLRERLRELVKAGEVQELEDAQSKTKEYRLLYKELPF